MKNQKTVGGNLLGGIFEGVKTHVLGEGEQNNVAPQDTPKFPDQEDDNGVKSTEVEIFGMKPATFGLITVGVVGATILGVYLYRKYGKKS
jgi:hypothetical protein